MSLGLVTLVIPIKHREVQDKRLRRQNVPENSVQGLKERKVNYLNNVLASKLVGPFRTGSPLLDNALPKGTAGATAE